MLSWRLVKRCCLFSLLLLSAVVYTQGGRITDLFLGVAYTLLTLYMSVALTLSEYIPESSRIVNDIQNLSEPPITYQQIQGRSRARMSPGQIDINTIVGKYIRVGMTEKQVMDFFKKESTYLGPTHVSISFKQRKMLDREAINSQKGTVRYKESGVLGERAKILQSDYLYTYWSSPSETSSDSGNSRASFYKINIDIELIDGVISDYYAIHASDKH